MTDDILPDFGRRDDMVLPVFDRGALAVGEQAQADRRAAGEPDLALPEYPPAIDLGMGGPARDRMTFGENVRGTIASGSLGGAAGEMQDIATARSGARNIGDIDWTREQLLTMPASMRRRIREARSQTPEDRRAQTEAAYERIFEQAAYDLSQSRVTPQSIAGTVVGTLAAPENLINAPRRLVAPIAEGVASALGARAGRIATTAADAAITNTAVDPAIQGTRLLSGGQDEYNVGQTLMAPVVGAAGGALLRGAIEAPSFVRGEARALDLRPETFAPAPQERPTTGPDGQAAAVPSRPAGEAVRAAGDEAVGRPEGQASERSQASSDIGGVERPAASQAPEIGIERPRVEGPAREPVGRVEVVEPRPVDAAGAPRPANVNDEVVAAAMAASPDAVARSGADAPSPMSARADAEPTRRGGSSYQEDARFNRRGLRGEGADRAEPVELKPEEVRDFRVGQAMQDLAARIGRKLEVDGRFTLRNALGEYKPKPGVIRIRQAGDFQVFSHELGHAIDQHLQGSVSGPAFKQLMRTHAAELRSLDANTSDPGKQTVKEGVAEFLRMAINNPAFAARQAPNFAAAFDDLLARQAPDIRALIADASRVSQIDSGMLPTDLARSVVMPAVEPKGIKALREEAKRHGIPVTLENMMNRFFVRVTGQDHYGKVLLRRLQDANFENTGKPMAEWGWSNPYKALRALPSASQAAVDAIQGGVRTYGQFFDGPKSPSLYAALKEAANGNISKMTDETSPEYRSFSAYVTMRAARGRYLRFMEGEVPKQPLAMSFREVERAIADFEAANPQFPAAADKVFAFNRAYWGKLRDAGLISTELHGAVAGRGEDYVPLNRFFDDKEGNVGPSSTNERSVVKTARGSTRPVLDPIQQTMLNVAQFERVIAINDIYRGYAKLAEGAGPLGGMIMERIPNKELRGESVDVMDMVRSSMRKAGADKAETETILRAFEEFVGQDATASVFKNVDTTARGENVVFLWENGERRAYKLANDEMSRGFYDMMSSMNEAERDALMKMLGVGNAMFSQLITQAPQFGLKNLIMDGITRMFIARHTGLLGRIPFAPLATGIYTHIFDKEFSKAYAAMGGIRGGVVSSALRDLQGTGGLSAIELAPAGLRDTASHYATMAVNPLQWPQFAKEAVSDAVIGYFKLLEATETAGRLGQAKIVYRHLKKQGLSDYEAMNGAVFEGRDVLDYDRRGIAMQGLTKFLPFLNPGVQGTARANRNLISEPLAAARQAYQRGGYDALDGEMKSALRDSAWNWAFIAGATVLTLGYWASVKDDPIYQRASAYMRRRYWIFPLREGRNGEDDVYISIPKPFDLPGAILSATEVAADGVSRADPEGWHRVADALREGFIPRQFGSLQDFLGANPFLKTGFEVQTGTRLGFEGSASTPLVPMALRGVQPQDQTTGNTSEFAKRLGRATGSSPIVIDHVINGLGGTAGRDVNDAITATLGNNPRMTPGDAFTKMFFGALYRTQRGVGSARNDLTRYMEGDGAKVMAPANSYRMAIRNGETDRAAEIYNAANDLTRTYMNIAAYNFPPQDRQLHPLEHASSFSRIASALTRDLASNRIVVQDRSARRGQVRETIDLQPGDARGIMNTLNSWASEEIRNGLTIAGVPGYQAMDVVNTEQRLQAIRSLNPRVAEEIETRLKAAHWLPSETVQRNWPEVRRRLLADRQDADLTDLHEGANARRASTRGRVSRRRIETLNAED